MTFLTAEQSTTDGRPLELLKISRSGANPLGYTTGNAQITFDSVVYVPLPWDRSAPTQDQAGNAGQGGDIRISLPRDNEFASQFIATAPVDTQVVSIYRYHPDVSPQEFFLFWKGFVDNVQFKGSLSADINCRPITRLFSRTGPRMRFQVPCNNVLFDELCGLDENNFKAQLPVTEVSAGGTQITVPGASAAAPVLAVPSEFRAGYYIGGFIRLPDGMDHRQVVNQIDTDTMVIQHPFKVSPLGSTIEIFAGCDLSIETCLNKFNNVRNHTGHKYVPVRNVFTRGLN